MDSAEVDAIIAALVDEGQVFRCPHCGSLGTPESITPADFTAHVALCAASTELIERWAEPEGQG